jgi:SAM-dependent methyltransferase
VTPTGSAQHYEQLLAEHYTWMMGGIDACLARARGLLDAVGLKELAVAIPGARVLDLGCGPGYHARALAELGCEVLAVDDSPTCLAELQALCHGLHVVTLQASLIDAATDRSRGPFAAVLCVGDTLPHLASAAEAHRLVRDAAQLLVPRGLLVLEFREQPREFVGADAVLTTRAMRDRLMQCVLDYEPERVRVTDVVHEWNGQSWTTRKSSYFKLRLSGTSLAAQATGAGLTALLDTVRAGQRTLVFRSA